MTSGISTFGANKGPNSVNEGIQIVQKMLGDGRIKIMSQCHNLIAELESYRWSEKKNKEDVVKENDHLLDALRYAIFTRERTRGRLLDSDKF